jgi:hypothetical protein
MSAHAEAVLNHRSVDNLPIFQSLSCELFRFFLGNERLQKWACAFPDFAAMTENFCPKDLKHLAAKIKLKFGLGNHRPLL